MSARMKKHHTNINNSTLYIVDNDTFYAIPKTIAKPYIVETKKTVNANDSVSARNVFKEYDKKYGKAAGLLKGLRSRENLSQTKFAKKIGVSQPNLSKMENGERPIGKIIAKRIAKIFSVDYRYFLE